MQTSPLQQIHLPLLTEKKLCLWIKRDDLIHPLISGNKWRKLKHSLLYAKNNDFRTLISFGGAFSNHIHALSVAAKYNDLGSVGIIRGEPHYADNPTLAFAQSRGMSLHFVDRETYRLRDNTNMWQHITSQYERPMLIPEGGSNELALKGVAEIIEEIRHELQSNQHQQMSTLVLPLASGGTVAGLLSAKPSCNIEAIAVLKNKNGYLQKLVNELFKSDATNWKVIDGYDFGGYAKFDATLIQFCQQFYEDTGVPLEPVYSGKMMYALLDRIMNDEYSPNQTIVALHTGGLQGIDGLRFRQLISDDQLNFNN